MEGNGRRQKAMEGDGRRWKAIEGDGGRWKVVRLAQDALRKIRTRKHKAQSPAAARKQLAVLIKLPHWKKTRLEKIGAPQKRRDCTVQHYRLHLDGTWTLPLSECTPPRAKGAELILTDGGRRASAGLVDAALAQGRQVL